MDRTWEAIDHITSYCSGIGSCLLTSATIRFLTEFSSEIEQASPSLLFGDRYKEHVCYSVRSIASHNFMSPPAALASSFLCTRFEYYFRVLSGRLTSNGQWLTEQDRTEVRNELQDPRTARRTVASVALAYRIMKLDPDRAASKAFRRLDLLLFSAPVQVADGRVLVDTGDRIEFLRNSLSHGELADISAEGVFYALLTAMVFYNQD